MSWEQWQPTNMPIPLVATSAPYPSGRRFALYGPDVATESPAGWAQRGPLSLHGSELTTTREDCSPVVILDPGAAMYSGAEF